MNESLPSSIVINWILPLLIEIPTGSEPVGIDGNSLLFAVVPLCDFFDQLISALLAVLLYEIVERFDR